MRAHHVIISLVTIIAFVSVVPSLALIPIGIKTDNIIISPSIAKANLLDLGSDLEAAVNGGAEWLHFSIQDGRMVPKISFGAPLVAACRTKFTDSVVFDVKLGCVEPEHRVQDFIDAGADVISVHPESTRQLSAVLARIQGAGVGAGVVLNPGTSIAAVEHVLDQCQVVVVMLVNPGYGGPKFMKPALHKIQTLRQLKPDLHISVDGGVNEENAPQLIASGANVLVAGGGVFKATDKASAIAALKACARGPLEQ